MSGVFICREKRLQDCAIMCTLCYLYKIRYSMLCVQNVTVAIVNHVFFLKCGIGYVRFIVLLTGQGLLI